LEALLSAASQEEFEDTKGIGSQGLAVQGEGSKALLSLHSFPKLEYMVGAQEFTENLLKVVVFSNLKQGLLALAIDIELVPYGHVAVHLGQFLAADDIPGISIEDLVLH
jgi:hypothetical protein